MGGSTAPVLDCHCLRRSLSLPMITWLLRYFSIGHGSLSSGITIKYKTNEQASVVCDEGYQLKHNSNNKIVCRQLL